ncbi:hypothetical protein AS200_09360 [Streptomyces sp. CdTB01]|nr:hypothetical protein AS200_09360 [Streptomyces sp. CdTB01]
MLPDTPLTTAVMPPRGAKEPLPPQLERAATLIAARNGDMAGAFVALQAMLLHGPLESRLTAMVPVLFRVEDTASPLAAALTLRTIPEGPAGLFPDPRTMYAASATEDFAASLTAAWQWVHGKRPARTCVVWSVTQSGNAELRLRGGSMGAPLAVALERLLAPNPAGGLRRLLISQRNRYAITGAIDRSGNMKKVGGLAAKLSAARNEAWHVIAPEENRQELLAQTPAEVTVLHAATLEEAGRQVNAVKKARLAISAVIALLMVGSGFTVYAGMRADASAQTANRERLDQQLLAQAQNLRQRDPQLALRLGVTAMARHAPNARAALIDTLTTSQYAGTSGIPAAESVLAAPHRSLMASIQGHIITLWHTDERPYRKAGMIPDARGGFGMTFSPDARTLAVTEEGGAVVLWDIRDPDQPKRRSPLTLAGKQVKALGTAISPDGKLMAVSQADRRMGVWDISHLSAPRLLGRTQLLSGGFIDQLSFTADGRHMVTSAYDEQDPPAVLVWDLTDPHRPRTGGYLGSSASMAVASPKGTTAAVVNGSGKTTLWDISRPNKPKALGQPLTDHTAAVRTIAFSPDGTMMATGGDDRRIILYDTSHPSSPQVYATLQGHAAAVTSLTFSPDGRTLTATSGKQTLVWATHPPSSPEALPDIPSDAMGVVLAPDRRLLLTYFLSGTVWNLDRRGHATRRPDLPEDIQISAAAFSPDDRLLVVLNTLDISRSIGTIDVYDLRDGSAQLVSSTRRKTTADEDTMVFSPDGRLLALPDGEHQVGLWSLADPRRPLEVQVLAGQHSDLSMLQFSPDGRQLAAIDSDGTLTRWATDTGTLTRTRNIARKLPSPMYDGNGKRIEYGDVSGVPLGNGQFVTQQDTLDQLWSWGSGRGFTEVSTARPTLFGADRDRASGTRSLEATSADGRLAISRGPNTQVQIWDVTAFDHPNLLGEFAANPEDGLLDGLSLSQDGGLLVMATQTKVKVRDLTPLKRIADEPNAAACQLADGGLTQAEWDHYLPGVPYSADCPATKGPHLSGRASAG